MKKRLVSVLAIVGLLAVAALGIAAVASAQAWPPVKPIMAGAVSSDGKVAAFAILILNDSPDRLLSMDIRAALHGNRLLRTWAGNPESHRAKGYGDSIGWVNQANIAPGRAQGPFVFVVDVVGAEGAVSHAWLRFKTDRVSADVTGDLIVAEIVP